MKKYDYLLFDIDGTVLDFKAAEKAAIQKLFPKFGFGECSDETVAEYSEINVRYWEALERGEQTKPQILVGRFREFFVLKGLDPSLAESFNAEYSIALGDTIVFCDDSLSLLRRLKGEYTLVAITNGTAFAQNKKLAASGLDKIFDYIFISENVGFEKPAVEYFSFVLNAAGIKDKSRALIIGDSLTSDIQGGINSGIQTCWYNPHGKPRSASTPADFEIRNLNEILNILQ